jgi:hypothetical protein
MQNDPYPASVSEVIDAAMKFRPGVLRVCRDFKRAKPWRGSMSERQEKFRVFHAALAEAYDMILPPQLIFGNDRVGCSGRSCYVGFPVNAIVLRGKLSVVSYLHEFAHARGMGERDATRWSVNLFRRVWPTLYARCRHEGHMLRAPSRDGA